MSDAIVLPQDPATAAPVPSREDYREAMSRLAAAVNIITTDGPGGRAGFTASAVCSVTDAPPTLLVCLNRSASVYPAFAVNGVLCVNALGAGQQGLSGLFGGKTPMEARFCAGHWRRGEATGSPVLDDAAVSFECRVLHGTPVGTHDVLFCEVQSITLHSEMHALMYFGRQYHELRPAACGRA